MKLLFKLLKIDLINTLSLNSYANKAKTKAKSKSPMITIIVSYVFMFLLFCIYLGAFSLLCHTADKDYAIIIIGVGLGGFLSLLMTFGKANAVLFQSKDFESLASMPIPTKTIVTSKIMSLLIVNYLYFNMSFVISLVAYIVLGNFTAYTIPVGIVIFLLGPILSTIVCTIISYFVGLLFSKSKYKNIFSTIISVIFFLLLFGGILYLEMFGTELEDNAEYAKMMINNLENVFSKGYFMSVFASKAMEGELINLLWFALISIIPLVAFIYIISTKYVTINSRRNNGYKDKNFKLDKTFSNVKTVNPISSLIKKEFKTLFSINVYAMNVIISPIMSTILTIILCISFKQEVNAEGAEVFRKMLPILVILMSAFSIGMCPSTGSSISMEGRSFWILKCSPLKIETIFIAKSLIYIIMCLPFIVINTIIASILLELSISSIIFVLITPIVICIAYTFISLWMNTINARFDWTNPTQIIKGGSTFVIMILNLVVDIVLFLPTILICISSDTPMVAYIINLVISILVMVGSYFLVMINGKKRFEKLDY